MAEVAIAISIGVFVVAAFIGGLMVHSVVRVRAFSRHLPTGFVCNEYSGAFDTGPGKCPFCSTDLLQLRRKTVRMSPRGEAFAHHTEFAGVACPSCLTAAKSDLSRTEWLKLEDFCQ